MYNNSCTLSCYNLSIPREYVIEKHKIYVNVTVIYTIKILYTYLTYVYLEMREEKREKDDTRLYNENNTMLVREKELLLLFL